MPQTGSPNKEPAWIETWRRAFKKQFSTSEDFTRYEQDNTPFNFKNLRGQGESPSPKKIPLYESPEMFPILMCWSKELEAAIPQTGKPQDDKKPESFNLEHSPYIITRRMGELNAAVGLIPGPDDAKYYYIALDSFFVDLVIGIGRISSHLFDMRNLTNTGRWKEIFEQNLERSPDIYKYFRDVFFVFMLYRNKHLGDDNLRKTIADTFVNQRDFFSLPDFDEHLFINYEGVIEESIGLFVMGHEYAHIILHLEAQDTSDYNNEILKFYEKEYQADILGLILTLICINDNYDHKKEPMATLFCAAGVEIAFNCLYITDRLRGVLDGSGGARVYETHPPTNFRMKNIRKYIENNQDIPDLSDLLDALDDIFRKLGDRFFDELSNSEHFLNFLQAKRKRIEILENEVNDFMQKREDLRQKNEPLDPELDGKIISVCKCILAEEPNNVSSLFMLGSLYLGNDQDGTALEYFWKIIYITSRDLLENKPFDHTKCYVSHFYVGYCHFRELVSIMSNSGGKPNLEQKKKMVKLIDDAMLHFETALPWYNHDGWTFFYYGVALSYKNRHPEAVENFKKALEYQPGNPQILLALSQSLAKLGG
jgi:tetratricopeptide (TPR) repeat protein